MNQEMKSPSGDEDNTLTAAAAGGKPIGSRIPTWFPFMAGLTTVISYQFMYV